MENLKEAVEKYNSSLPVDDDLEEYCDFTQFMENIEGLIHELIEQYHESGSDQIERWRNSSEIVNYYEFPYELRYEVLDFAVEQVFKRIKR